MTLPTPDPAFRWNHETWGDSLRCRPLEQVAQHLFTTRQLQLRPFDRQTDGWAAAVKSVGGTLGDLVRIRQVHGRAVRVAVTGDTSGAPPPDADAVVSNTPGHVLAVQVADCVPLLLADARTGAAAAVHAGWRGSAAGIVAAAVQAMTAEFGVRPAELTAAMGPSIGACCYEVGAELMASFRDAGASDEQIGRWFTRAENESLRLDLWTATRDQLLDCGLASDHIYMSRLCTRTHASVFDSYRAAGPNAGRMAALVRVPSPL